MCNSMGQSLDLHLVLCYKIMTVRRKGTFVSLIDFFVLDLKLKIFHRISTLSVEKHLAQGGVPEEDEPAEGDEGELEVPHAGDHPPHRHRHDAHGRPQRPTPTGISSEIGTKLRDLAIGQAGAGCYSQRLEDAVWSFLGVKNLRERHPIFHPREVD